ncbi:MULTISPECIES: AMP-binding protein [unclassified Bradyrhizobium]|jgi:acyl-CoA synthetase (AMP-forming)/AMP-acid ligase II|uniref:class I adenylate-forming enzyme family protein n=1 Tax=unclassified Bradyrhizobium TaxID=2631580 RepID=UPI00070A7929|nr:MULTISPECIES: AMP-binding protein [unclassified Bradyrhizobium]KQT03098.1 acid--CoA ligase [Bradyrhizobium sp. Leaf396]
MPEILLAAGQANVYGLFRTCARKQPSSAAIEYEGLTVSYGDLLKRVDAIASALLGRGVNPGDRIAILSHNRPDYVELQLAAAAIGAIVACLNWRLSPAELKHCIELVEPVMAVVEPELHATFAAVSELPTIQVGPELSRMSSSAALDSRLGTLLESDEEGLTILFTSGTTGLPKGALVSHRAHVARAMAFSAELMLDPRDAFVAWAPMFHMASTDHMLATLMRGGTVVIINGFQPEAINMALSQHKIGWLVMMPGVVDAFIEERKARPTPIKGIKICGAMADLVPRHQIAELTRLLDAPYLNSFGATETGLPPASGSVIEVGVTPTDLAKRISSFCEIRLVDPLDNDVPDGEPGEMVVRGPTLFSGYWNAPETNAVDFRGGMFHMGDTFRRLPDGRVDFVDRVKYMIKSGGENVYPAEIERVLLAHPAVLEAAVVKASDPKWGERPVAFVACDEANISADEILRLCSERLAGYKRPREIRFIAFDDFPRSTSGKVQRHVLEDRLKDQASGSRTRNAD